MQSDSTRANRPGPLVRSPSIMGGVDVESFFLHNVYSFVSSRVLPSGRHEQLQLQLTVAQKTFVYLDKPDSWWVHCVSS